MANAINCKQTLPWLIQSHQDKDDRVSNRLKLNWPYLLIVSLLLSTGFVNMSNAQKTNELVFEGLVIESWKKHGRDIDTLIGFVTANLDSEIVCIPGALYRFIIDPPSVVFTKIGRHQFQRKLETIVNFQDTVTNSFILTHQDTLSGKELARVRHSQFMELRGRNPRWTSKYLAPAVLIGTAIAGIISLFYLRS